MKHDDLEYTLNEIARLYAAARLRETHAYFSRLLASAAPGTVPAAGDEAPQSTEESDG